MMISLFVFLISLLSSPAYAQEDTWYAPAARDQVDMDRMLIPMGKGSVFVPTMTNSLAEPVYIVYSEGRKVASSETGKSTLLRPGTYEVRIGSGTIEQMTSRTVEVREGHTTLIRPDWTGLIIDVIDETRSSVRKSYELFSLSDQQNYGIGYGIDEELGEELKTWLLKPGIYKIVKTGQSFTTTVNFATIRLFPGELVKYTLVVDSETGNFIGFGILGASSRQIRLRNWTLRSEINGNFIFNYANTLARRRQRDFSFSAQSYNTARYTSPRFHNLLARVILEEGLTRQQGESFRKFIDKIELRGTYIYRFVAWMGPYIRFTLDSKFFATRHYFDKARDYVKVNAAGDTVEVVRNATEVTLSPSFFPLVFKEGIGGNLVLYKSLRLNVNLRAGYGARQTYVRDSYRLSDDRSRIIPLKRSGLTGIEVLLIGNTQIARNVTADSEFDMLMPEWSPDTWVYDWETRIRTFLSKQVSLDYNIYVRRQEDTAEIQSEHRVLIRFSYVL